MGGAASVTYGLLFLVLGSVTPLPDVVVTMVATIASTVLSNELHRRVTFRADNAASVARGHSAGSGMAVVGLLVNSLAVAGWNALAPGAGAVATLAVVYCVNGLVGLANFVVLRRALTGRPAPGLVTRTATALGAGLARLLPNAAAA
jgi:putative flippase GtrA